MIRVTPMTARNGPDGGSGDLTAAQDCAFGRMEMNCPATLWDVRRMIVALDGHLRRTGVPQQVLDDVNIVLGEVLTNVARHAYPLRTGDVRCRVARGSLGLRCRVSDAGLPFDPTMLGRGFPAPDMLAQGGYGWALIRRLTTDLRYTRVGAQNVLRFTIPDHDAPRMGG